MRTIVKVTGLIVLFTAIYSFTTETQMKKESVYKVTRLTQPIKIDANWDNPQWKNIPVIDITNYMGPVPKFQPEVHAKMMYDDNNF